MPQEFRVLFFFSFRTMVQMVGPWSRRTMSTLELMKNGPWSTIQDRPCHTNFLQNHVHRSIFCIHHGPWSNHSASPVVVVVLITVILVEFVGLWKCRWCLLLLLFAIYWKTPWPSLPWLKEHLRWQLTGPCRIPICPNVFKLRYTKPGNPSS